MNDVLNTPAQLSIGFFEIGVSITIILVALVTIGLILARLYTRSSKEMAFVRTGLGGEKVIMDGGAIVLPVLHDIIQVNMNTLRLEVSRSNEVALITKNRMRVDVAAEFYVRVAPNREAISMAAQTLGMRTKKTELLRELIEGKFVDVLRSVAAEMSMEELHEKRSDFVQRVQNNVKEDLEKNGLELETVSLTGLDQTDPKYFRTENAFDAEGLTHLTKITEERKKQRNDVEQETVVAIQKKNLATKKESLEIAREEEYAELQQQREIELRRADQAAEIAQRQAEKKREAEEAQILASRLVETARIVTERTLAEEGIIKEKSIQEKNISKVMAVEEAEILKQRTLELAKQDQAIAIAEKSKGESLAKAEANKALASAVREEEQVATVRETSIAERRKEIELIEARRMAEQSAIGITVAAEADKVAAEDKAEALRTEAQARAEKVRIEATGEADAEKLRAEAKKVTYQVEAEGKQAIHAAENTLSPEIIAMQLKMALVEHLPAILREAVKPMERIESIKVLQVSGLVGGSGGGSTHTDANSNLADQVTNAALRYKAQAPLVESLLKELGLSGQEINGFLKGMQETPSVTGQENSEPKGE